MEFSTYLKEGLVEAAQRLVRNYSGDCQAESLALMEREIQAMVHEVAKCVTGEWLEKQAGQYPADTDKCECGERARYVRHREAVSITLHGRVRYRRAYYVCGCGRGHCPLDDRLRIEPGQLSVEVKTVAALLGVQAAFATSSATLARLLPLELSPNTIRAVCQEVGDSVLGEEAELLNACQDLHRQTATQRQQMPSECLYVSLDGFQAPFEDGWHELKAGVFWTVDDTGQANHQHYFVDTVAVDAFAALVWAKAWQHGADLAKRLVFIADGSAWIWRIAQRLFPNAVHIIDWFHAASYLATIAADAFGEGSPAAKAWFQAHKTLLYDGQLGTLARACRAIRSQAPTASDAARRYFANNRTRLRYPTYRALGLQIGSGVMESACKQIGAQRLKLPGARWSNDGARKLAKARAVFLTRTHPFAPFSLTYVA
jgi:hypothetical protein